MFKRSFGYLTATSLLFAAAASTLDCNNGSTSAAPATPASTSTEAAPAPTAPYEPCADKACGEACTLCAPGDDDCMETAVVKMCNAEGSCSSDQPGCR